MKKLLALAATLLLSSRPLWASESNVPGELSHAATDAFMLGPMVRRDSTDLSFTGISLHKRF